VSLLVAAVTALVGLGWRRQLATRLDRAHTRVIRSRAVLDAALVRRAHQAIEVARRPGTHPATTRMVCDAAVEALEPGLTPADRECAESVLTHVLGLAQLSGVQAEQDRVTLARRLHNDAVTTARTLRRRRVVRLFLLAGRGDESGPFEMADGDGDGAPVSAGRDAAAPAGVWGVDPPSRN
jgi:hypothetical protein